MWIEEKILNLLALVATVIVMITIGPVFVAIWFASKITWDSRAVVAVLRYCWGLLTPPKRW